MGAEVFGFKDEIRKVLEKDISISEMTDELNALFVSSHKRKVESIDWDKLLDFFNTETGMSKKIVSEKVRVKIKARLKEGYTKTDIINTIVNAAADEFHKDNLYKYLTLEYISRSDVIDRFSEVKAVSKPKLGMNT